MHWYTVAHKIKKFRISVIPPFIFEICRVFLKIFPPYQPPIIWNWPLPYLPKNPPTPLTGEKLKTPPPMDWLLAHGWMHPTSHDYRSRSKCHVHVGFLGCKKNPWAGILCCWASVFRGDRTAICPCCPLLNFSVLLVISIVLQNPRARPWEGGSVFSYFSAVSPTPNLRVSPSLPLCFHARKEN